MSLKWIEKRGWHIARFRERNLDERNLDYQAITAYIESLPRGCKVAISFRGVEWVSSWVLGMLVVALKTVSNRGGKFAITSPGEKIMEALKITKLHRSLVIKDSTNDLD